MSDPSSSERDGAANDPRDTTQPSGRWDGVDRSPPRRPLDVDAQGWRRRTANEIRAELAEHVERRTASLMAAGYSPDAARAEALRRMGNLGRIEEECMRIAERRRSRARVAGWFDGVTRDAVVALRSYGRRPVTAASVVLTMALGIGAATAVFSMVRGVLLEPLPFPHSGDLYSVYTRYLPESGYDFEYFPISGPELVDYRQMTRVMTGIAAYGAGFMNVTPPVGEPERLRVVQATADLFHVLGVSAAHGRAFAESDGEASARCVAVLSDGTWRDRFGADASVIGRDVSLNGQACTLVGVMPPGFAFPDERTALYRVLKLDPASPQWERESHPFVAVARIAAGASRRDAETELDALRAGWSQAYPEHHGRGHFVVLRPLSEDIVGDARTPLLVLFGAVALVLVIVTANVAGLMLANMEARRREFAVRAALGVGRGRLLRQLLTESVLLALIGGGAGVLAANWILRTLLALYPGRLPRAGDVQIDGFVVLFGIAVAMASGVIFGLLPALRTTRVGVGEVLRSVGRGLTASSEGVRTRQAFVVAQTAFALVLVTAAAVLARSYAQLRSVELGFDPRGVLTFAVAVPASSYPDDAQARAYFHQLEQRLAGVPGVVSTGTVSDVPLRSGGGADDFIIEGRPLPGPGQPAWNARYQMATPGALKALGLQLAAGRWLESTDAAGAPPVAVINEATARAYFAGASPIGTRIRYYGPDSTWITIVGVVRDVKQLRVTEDAPPAVYAALAQTPRPAYTGRLMNLLVRFRGDATMGAPAVRAAVHELNPSLPPSQLMTMDDVVAEATAESRFTTALMAGFAAVALLLGALGVHGVLAHMVHLRRDEIGVRLALGAAQRSVLTMVVRQGVVLVLAGALIGVVAAVVLRKTLSGLVFGVQPFDPVSLLAAIFALLITSLAACWIPALRAARVDPLAALRGE